MKRFSIVHCRRQAFACCLLLALPCSGAAAEIRVVDDKRQPLADVHVVVFDSRQTLFDQDFTNDQGVVEFALEGEDEFTLLCAHDQFGGAKATWRQEDDEDEGDKDGEDNEDDEGLVVRLRARPRTGSVIVVEGSCWLPLLRARLYVSDTDDKQRKLRVGDGAAFEDGSEIVVPPNSRKTLRAKKTGLGEVELRPRDAVGEALLFECRNFPQQAESSLGPGEVQVLSAEGFPVAKAEVCLVAEETGAMVYERTDETGVARFSAQRGARFLVFAAHPLYRAFMAPGYDPQRSLIVRLQADGRVGSLICPNGSGSIDGTRIRLNPILDTLGRTYLYATNAALDGGKQQPVYFRLNTPILAQDAEGQSFRMQIRAIVGKTSLVEIAPEGGVARDTPPASATGPTEVSTSNRSLRLRKYPRLVAEESASDRSTVVTFAERHQRVGVKVQFKAYSDLPNAGDLEVAFAHYPATDADRLFVEGVFLILDGQELPFNTSGGGTSHGRDEEIREFRLHDAVADAAGFRALAAIARQSNITVRFVGRSSSAEYALLPSQVDGLYEAYAAYKELGGDAL